MKTYVVIVSKYFPKSHPRSGEDTGFVQAILNGEKKHTIRLNYELWEERFRSIHAGYACLSVRYWIGKPYRSKQKEIKRFTYNDPIGLECLQLPHINEGMVPEELAKNDGLSQGDFIGWFKGIRPYQKLALIHFGAMRYCC